MSEPARHRWSRHRRQRTAPGDDHIAGGGSYASGGTPVTVVALPLREALSVRGLHRAVQWLPESSGHFGSVLISVQVARHDGPWVGGERLMTEHRRA
jgi:hypothetical protein